MSPRHPRLPDFFIIGAPRCGTTALWKYLQQHPQVFLPPIKEPHYFAPDFQNTGIAKCWDAYTELFTSAPVGTRIGEASVWYLYSSMAVAQIVRTLPDAQMIVMLRNPVDAAYSLFSYKHLLFEETVDDFEEAWWLSSQRAQEKNLPVRCREPRQLIYRDIYSYSQQLRKLFSHIGCDNIFVGLYEDFAQDEGSHYREVSGFLHLNFDGTIRFPGAAGNKVYKNKFWQRAVGYAVEHRRAGAPLAKLADACVKRTLGAHGRNRLIRRLTRGAWLDTRREPLDARVRHRILAEMEDEIREVEELLERRLDVWRR